MQLKLTLTPDVAKLYANDKYQNLTGKEARIADKLILEALIETAGALNRKLERLETCMNTEGMTDCYDYSSVSPHINCVTHLVDRNS